MNKVTLTVCVGILSLILLTRFALLDLNESEYVNGQNISLTTTITQLPKISGSIQKITIFDETRTPIFVTLPRDSSLEYGKTVKISGNLNFRVIDGKRTVLSIYFPTIEPVENESKTLLLAAQKAAFFVRSRSLDTFQKALPSNLASLLSGIVFGSKEEFSADFKLALQNAGVMHVVAASGMNVALVGGFISTLCMRLLRRQLALGVTIVALLLYAVLAGLEASIVRATIMGILIFTAQILGRQYLASFGLLLAGFFMLMYDPYLLWDVGFQLSFMATAGILFIPNVILRSEATKNLEAPQKQEKPRSFASAQDDIMGTLKADIKTTLSAQLATLPILVGTFGTFSPLSLLANILVLWTTPILMILGAIAALLGHITTSLGVLISYLALPFLWYFEVVIRLFGSFPAWEFSLSPLSVVGYYLVLISIVILNPERRRMGEGSLANASHSADKRRDSSLRSE